MPRPILFYDGGCPLCRREIAHYRRLDRDLRIDWRDLHAADAELARHGLTPMQAMRLLHAVDRQGRRVCGVPAFMLIWRELPGYRWLARLLEWLRLVGLLDHAYRRFARWRFGRRCRQGCGAAPGAD